MDQCKEACPTMAEYRELKLNYNTFWWLSAVLIGLVFISLISFTQISLSDNEYENQTAQNPLALLVVCPSCNNQPPVYPQADKNVTLNYCVNNAPPAGFELSLQKCGLGFEDEITWFGTKVTADDLLTAGATQAQVDTYESTGEQTRIDLYNSWVNTTYVANCPTYWSPTLDSDDGVKQPYQQTDNTGWKALTDLIDACKEKIK